jgi:ribosome biogenesis GTPase A
MARASADLQKHMKIIDVVVELVDARAPSSTSNPELVEITAGKPRVVVLNKADLADASLTPVWVAALRDRGLQATAANSVTGEGVADVIRLASECAAGAPGAAAHARGRRVRSGVAGIPNVGKSSFINRVARKSRAKTGDRPGVTRAKQWIVVSRDLEMLDTPGIMPPRVEDPAVWAALSFLGTIDDSLLDREAVAIKLIKFLLDCPPSKLGERFDLPSDVRDPEEILGLVAIRRGCVRTGGVPDLSRAADVVIREFRSGKLGRVTLETP